MGRRLKDNVIHTHKCPKCQWQVLQIEEDGKKLRISCYRFACDFRTRAIRHIGELDAILNSYRERFKDELPYNAKRCTRCDTVFWDIGLSMSNNWSRRKYCKDCGTTRLRKKKKSKSHKKKPPKILPPMKFCDYCSNEAHKYGMCKSHYERYKLTGDHRLLPF